MLSFLKYVQKICTWITFTWCCSINALLCSVMLSEVSSGSFIGASDDSLFVCFMHERSENVYHSMKSMSPLGYCIDAIMKTWTLQLQSKKVALHVPPKKIVWQVKAFIQCSINAQNLIVETYFGITVQVIWPFDQFWSLLIFHLLFLIKNINTFNMDLYSKYLNNICGCSDIYKREEH